MGKPMHPFIDLDDERFMRLALAQAKLALNKGEIPVGAVVASPSGRIIGQGYNLTETLCDVTAHAEMQAITAAEQTLGGKYLQGCTIYVTLEPCVMCAGAIAWSQIGRIVYGASDTRKGYSTITRTSPFHPRATVRVGVLEKECVATLQSFFTNLRK